MASRDGETMVRDFRKQQGIRKGSNQLATSHTYVVAQMWKKVSGAWEWR